MSQDPTYINELAEILYKACSKPTSSSKLSLGTAVKCIAMAITCRLEVFDWDGTETPNGGFQDLNNCLRKLVYTPKLYDSKSDNDATAINYILASLWVYLGIIQSYNLTQYVWNEQWEILGKIVKVSFVSKTEEVSDLNCMLSAYVCNGDFVA